MVLCYTDETGILETVTRQKETPRACALGVFYWSDYLGVLEESKSLSINLSMSFGVFVDLLLNSCLLYTSDAADE